MTRWQEGVMEARMLERALLDPQTSGPDGQACVLLAQLDASRWCETPWTIPWSREADGARASLRSRLPRWFGFHTSGQTGSPRLWLRDREQLLTEVRLLQQVCRVQQTDGIISFAPVHHLYGFLLSFLLPAMGRLPVWFRPVQHAAIPQPCGLKRPLVVTIPSAMAQLERCSAELSAFEQVTIVHSTACLPMAGLRLLEQVPGHRVHFLELFGSTETGLVAARWLDRGSEPSWDLVEDVRFAQPAVSSDEALLDIRSPRLAYDSDGVRPPSFQMDDYVRIVGLRSFRFYGRRSRLVKVNGQRVNLDRVEEVLRRAIPCLDLACMVARDDLRGERFDLLLVPHPNQSLDPKDIRRRCMATLSKPEQPQQIRLIPQLARSSLGKLRHLGGS